MIHPNIRIIEFAVRTLALLVLGLAILIYFLMEIYHRRQIARSARRLILSSKLFPPLEGEALRELWLRTRRSDRELVEDILVDICRSAESSVRAVVERSIIESGIFERWLGELRHVRSSRRVRAATRLGYVHDVRSVHELAFAGRDSSPDVKLAVTLSLGRLKDPAGLPGLLQVAAKPVREVPDLTLAAALAACAGKDAGRIVSLLQAREPRLRTVGAWALSEVADAKVLRNLLRASQDVEPEVRAKVARALARITNQESVEALERLARDPIWYVRVRALDALGALQAAGEKTILAGLEDQAREVRARAAFALRRSTGMRGDLAAKVLTSLPRASFESLISEWDQAGFIWQVVAGLSTRDFSRYKESQVTLRVLTAAGVVRALVDLILIFPDVKVRLRLLRLFLESATPEAQAELLSLAEEPNCDRRVAAAIKRAFPGAAPRVAKGVKPSIA